MLLVPMDYGEKIRVAGMQRRTSGRGSIPVLRQRAPRRAIYLVATAICLAFFWLTHRSADASVGSFRESIRVSRKPPSSSSSKKPFSIPSKGDLPCRSLPGANDTLVVMKTGSTELKDKLTIHLNTTLRCYPNQLIFSDYEEVYQGHRVLDALEFVNNATQNIHPDFEIWRRLRDGGGRAALNPSELSGPVSGAGSNYGKTENPGWKIDKWKFLPMMNRTLAEYPDMKWYVFVETDTYILWQTLLNYLNALDWRKPYYMGGQIWISDIVFAHGGTGFAVSRPALQKVVKMFQESQIEWENFTNEHWAGDCVLGKAFDDSGTPLVKAWPIWQGDHVGKMNYARAEGPMRLWCKPTVSYHHLTPSVVEDMWRWEMEWIDMVQDPTLSLRHQDMFEQYILPRTLESKKNWDNHADEDRGPIDSLEACRVICEAYGECVQYSLSAESRCLISSRPNLGELAKGVESGWMNDRMKKWGKDKRKCSSSQEAWTMS